MNLNLDKYLNESRMLIDSSIRKMLAEYPFEVPVLREAITYSLFGGKRLRGITLLSAYEAVGGTRQEAIPFAMGIEMIHAYSLVHDDLPCMDNDDFRRGKLTCHKKFGEAIALLCGDALLTMAFETMLSSRSGMHSDSVIEATFEIAKAAGVQGMVGGQVLDLQLEGQRGDRSLVSRMYRMKTGALFEVSAKAAGILRSCPRELTEALSAWGRSFGYAYQIIDDLEDSGKSEKEAFKDTLIKEASAVEAYQEAKKALEESIGALERLGNKAWFMERLSRRYAQKLEIMLGDTLIE